MKAILITMLALAGTASCKSPPPESPRPEPPPPGAVTPESQVLTFEVDDAWNRHSDFGADGKRLASRVTLALAGDGTVRVEDGGKLVFSHLDNVYGYEAETTEWLNVWTGTWAVEADVMTLDLVLEERVCEKKKGGLEGEGEEKLECDVADEKVRLECRDTQITLDPLSIDLAGADAGPVEATEDAWLCSTDGETGGTPMVWVFGKHACLEASSDPSFMSRTYAPCREEDAL